MPVLRYVQVLKKLQTIIRKITGVKICPNVLLTEALLETCHELKGGLSQPRAYENFGSRCPCPEYKILSVLLIQNLKKGNQNTLLLFQRKRSRTPLKIANEKHGFSEKKHRQKLLFPMLLQLVIVLALLMLPHF